MSKYELLKLWDELVVLPDCDLEFKSSGYGRHQEKLTDGWRTLIRDVPYEERTGITLEKQPGAWIMYSGSDRYFLFEEEGEKRVEQFDEINAKKQIIQ